VARRSFIRIGTQEWPLDSFEYQLLETPDTIRVIHVRPAEDFGAIESVKCDIEHIRMNEKTSYDALSYEWGSPADDDPVILLNDHDLTVRRNLFDALLTFRREGRYSYGLRIWVDALSINQSDTRERNHQVELMGMIYRRAVAVLVWPGMTQHYSATAVRTINDIRYYGKMKTDEVWQDTIYPAILELCQRSYWNRVWIQQEIYLGSAIYIISPSGGSIDYRGFDHILGLMTGVDSHCGKDLSSKIQQSAANALITRKRLPTDSSRLITWLRLACRRGLETSEPRDLIYAMLGISSDCQDGGGIEPDYDKPLIDVYLETVFFCGLHKPGQENKRFRKTLAEKLELPWDSDMETRIQEYCEQKATVRRED